MSEQQIGRLEVHNTNPIRRYPNETLVEIEIEIEQKDETLDWRVYTGQIDVMSWTLA